MDTAQRQCLLDIKAAGLITEDETIDFKRIISYPDLVKKMAELIWSRSKSLKFDYLCAPPTSALPFATLCSIKHHIPLLTLRNDEVLGAFEKGSLVMILEDFLSTGDNVLKVIRQLETVGLEVKDVIAFVDHHQGGNEKLATKGITAHTVISSSTLLETIC